MFSHKAHAVDPNHDVSSLVSSDPVISKLAAWHVWPLKQGPIGSSSLPKQTNQTNKPDKQTNMHHSSTKINQIAVLPFFFSIFPYLPQNQPPPQKKNAVDRGLNRTIGLHGISSSSCLGKFATVKLSFVWKKSHSLKLTPKRPSQKET